MAHSDDAAMIKNPQLLAALNLKCQARPVLNAIGHGPGDAVKYVSIPSYAAEAGATCCFRRRGLVDGSTALPDLHVNNAYKLLVALE